MFLLGKIIERIYFKRRLERIEIFKRQPFEVQAKNFSFLIKSAKNTVWGKEHDYSKIASETNFSEACKLFQSQVPVSSYDDIKPWITRTRYGEKNILWPGRVKWFSKSSGTTSDKSKYIPVTKTSLNNCHYAGGKDAFALYFKDNPQSKVLNGKTLSLGGSKRCDELNRKNSCGDMSAIIVGNLPCWAQLARVPKKEIALMEEWEEKLKAITTDTKNQNVAALAGVPSWVLVLLRKVEAETGKTIKELWPNLELFMHGGVAFPPYREQYKKLLGENVNYVEIYSSAEGFFGIGEDSSRGDMMLLLDHEVFYEFIPLEELGKKFPKAYLVSEVELNKNYAIIISTSGGLWRYLVGDTVKFTSLKPCRFIITGRIKSFINVFGEELMVDNADRAITIACEQTGALIREYSAAPVFMEEGTKGCHEWLIEFEKSPENLKIFTEILDKTLQSLNSDYEAKRYKDITLGELSITTARTGLFADWLASKNKLGGQNKIPRLSNNRENFEEMLRLN
ncbi:MAG: GH3 auxin-responsive promoter family protein [Patescibacteria group bacterium]